MNDARRFLTYTLGLFLVLWAGEAKAQPKLKDADCLTCHGDQSLTTDVNGKTVSLFVDEAKLKHGIHGRLFGCVDCHTDVKSLAHDTPPKKITCGQCHADAQEAYSHSAHAIARKEGAAAAGCQDCHGGAHEVMAGGDPKSPVNHENIPYTCGRCHGQKFLMESRGQSAQPFISYQESVHGRATEKGSQKAAVCTDCHGAHEILAANNAKSPIYKFNVPATCGKCHTDVNNTFMQSIHGQALERGNAQAPVCTDCHGIHSIKAHADPNSPASEQNLSKDICARCHEGVRLSQEFGVPGNKVSSYFDSYHGLAAEGGSVVAANCSSCHGVHNILPSSDPHSTINKANLDATCGQCHKGVTQKFTQTRVHSEDGVQPHDIGSLAVKWVRLIYIALILHCDWRDVPAQLHHLAAQGSGAAANDESVHGADDDESALAAPDSAEQFHHPGDHGLCTEVPGLMVCACVWHGRALARHHSSRGRSDSDRRGDLPRCLSMRRRGKAGG